MSNETLHITIDNATRTDLLELTKVCGELAVVESPKTHPNSRHAFGEPTTLTLIVTLSASAAGVFTAWLLKQRTLRRTTLDITITGQSGEVTTIKMSEMQYGEGKADGKLTAALAKAGLPIKPSK